MNSFGYILISFMIAFLICGAAPIAYLLTILSVYKDTIKVKSESGNKIVKLNYKEILDILYKLPGYYYDCNRETVIYTNIEKVGRQEFDIVVLGLDEIRFVSFRYSKDLDNTVIQHSCYIDSNIISIIKLRHLYLKHKKVLLRHNYINKEDIKVIDYELSTPIKFRIGTNTNLEPYLNISPAGADVFKETLKMF